MRIPAFAALCLVCLSSAPAVAQQATARAPSPPAVREIPATVRPRDTTVAVRQLPVTVRERTDAPATGAAPAAPRVDIPRGGVPSQFAEMLYRERSLDCAAVRCLPDSWRNELARWRNAPLIDQVYAVHTFVNRMPYVEDMKLYGKEDYWATPVEFALKGGGDCDDYAVAKHEALRWLGVPADRLLIAIVDTARGAHAILVVRLDEGPMVLDNGVDNLRTTAHPDYTGAQVVATEESGWWHANFRHGAAHNPKVSGQ